MLLLEKCSIYKVTSSNLLFVKSFKNTVYRRKSSKPSPCLSLTHPLAGKPLASGRSWPTSRSDRLLGAWPAAALRCDTLSPGRKGRRASPSAGPGRSEPSPRPSTQTTLRPPGSGAWATRDDPPSYLKPTSLWLQQGDGDRVSQEEMAAVTSSLRLHKRQLRNQEDWWPGVEFDDTLLNQNPSINLFFFEVDKSNIPKQTTSSRSHSDLDLINWFSIGLRFDKTLLNPGSSVSDDSRGERSLWDVDWAKYW